MASNEKERAQHALEAVLASRGGPDPREICREHLRELKERDRVAFDEAVRHYEESLVPGVAAGSLDPVAAWTEYALRLAESIAPGRTVAVDATGKAVPFEPGAGGDPLVLHLPHASSQRALLVALPLRPSDAQTATHEWLVSGRQKLPDAG